VHDDGECDEGEKDIDELMVIFKVAKSGCVMISDAALCVWKTKGSVDPKKRKAGPVRRPGDTRAQTHGQAESEMPKSVPAVASGETNQGLESHSDGATGHGNQASTTGQERAVESSTKAGVEVWRQGAQVVRAPREMMPEEEEEEEEMLELEREFGMPVTAEVKESVVFKRFRALWQVKKQRLREQNIRSQGQVHNGFSCDGCGQDPLVGVRWSCADCMLSSHDEASVDLCDECHRRGWEGGAFLCMMV
jgi:hypothetical protein